MSGVAYQTGAHISGVHQSSDFGELSEFPRFLCREEGERTANMPPPLPRVAWYVRVNWIMSRAAPRRMAALAAALVVLVPAAAALVMDAGPPQINVIQVKSIDQSPAYVSRALQTPADLEVRLGYGTKLANMYVPAEDTQTLEANNGERYAATGLLPSNLSGPPDSPAMLILRNLPENATFTTGEPAGKGEWVMAAGDPNQLDMTLGEGFDQPVTADVEIISHAGLTLGLLHLELRRNVAAVAEAQVDPAPQEPVSLAEAEKAEPKDEANEAEAKPRRRARRASARSKSKFARADGGYIKRIKKGDHWKTETVEAADSAGNQKSTDAGADKSEDETAKGPISKFFSWITGGGTSTAPADGVDPEDNKAAMFPQ